ncbi:MAG: hypothetical protein QM638_14580 [Nocardioides sp.]|uniref:hypothetical protein n=1 Tax=Nocardioides sp. TaxID=35761 RepID=UPI0039E3E791
MTTIDLGVSPDAADAVPPPIEEPWAGVPRRIGLTIAELRLACAVIGAPMPFEVRTAESASALDARLGRSRRSAEDEAYAAAVTALGDPAVSLRARDLMHEDGADPARAALDAGLAGALGLLATPEVAVEIDVVTDEVRIRSWQRQAGDVVATLATADGLVFELAWFGVEHWPAELARVAALPSEDDTDRPASRVPDHVEVPFELADAVFEALRAGRTDLVGVLTSGDATLTSTLTAFTTETRGRLRAVVGAVPRPGDPTAERPIGVTAWTLVADGWCALRTAITDGEPTLVITRVQPTDLAAELAPVLAEVAR